jgi:hypothetical protein
MHGKERGLCPLHPHPLRAFTRAAAPGPPDHRDRALCLTSSPPEEEWPHPHLRRGPSAIPLPPAAGARPCVLTRRPGSGAAALTWRRLQPAPSRTACSPSHRSSCRGVGPHPNRRSSSARSVPSLHLSAASTPRPRPLRGTASVGGQGPFVVLDPAHTAGDCVAVSPSLREREPGAIIARPGPRPPLTTCSHPSFLSTGSGVSPEQARRARSAVRREEAGARLGPPSPSSKGSACHVMHHG